MNEAVSFGGWLKQKRKILDLSQEDLAERVGCSIWTIRKIETGERRPSRQVAQLLLERLGVPPQDRESLLTLSRGGFLPQEPASNCSNPPLSDLPVPLTPLIGRAEALDSVRETLLGGEVRLLTVLGPPGIGKTHLALTAAGQMAREFEDGVVFVPLGPIRDPELVPQAIAGTLDLKETTQQTALSLVARYFRTKRSLLVLDNFEQVIDASSSVASLLTDCPGLAVLVTSREALRIRGENLLDLPPLETPEFARLPALGVLAQFSAIRLFVERARAISDFVLTEENAQAVAAICSRMDGLPLAIELVAARSRLLPPEALLARLDDNLLCLSGPRDLDPRHRTLKTAISWSYDLLGDAEKVLFTRLGVFAGGATLAAIEAVCNARGDLRGDVVQTLESLFDKSLLRKVSASGEIRLSMLETIREYALESLKAEEDTATDVSRLHAEYYLAMAETADAKLTGMEQTTWLSKLTHDHDNFRAALRWAIDFEEAELAGRLGGALGHFWYTQGHLSEGRRWIAEILDCMDSVLAARHRPGLESVLAKVLTAAGMLSTHQGDYSAATSYYEEGLRLYRKLGDTGSVAYALNRLGVIANEQAEYARADGLYQESLGLYQQLGDLRGTAICLNNIANQARIMGNLDRADEMHTESLNLALSVGDKRSEALALLNLGINALYQHDYSRAESLLTASLQVNRSLENKGGIAAVLNMLAWVSFHVEDYEQAQSHFRASLDLCRELGDQRGIASTEKGLACVYLCLGDYRAATPLYDESARIFLEIGDKSNLVECLEGIASVASYSGDVRRAARLFGAAEGLRELIGLPAAFTERPFHKENLARVYEEVRPEDLTNLWQEGRSMAASELQSLQLIGYFQ